MSEETKQPTPLVYDIKLPEGMSKENVVLFGGLAGASFNDEDLPERFRTMLGVLPDGIAGRLRMFVRGMAISEIENNLDQILDDAMNPMMDQAVLVREHEEFERKIAAGEIKMPELPVFELPPPPPDPWDVLDEKVGRFADAFKKLTEAGMTEPVAINMIDKLRSEKQKIQVVSHGAFPFPTAGIQATEVYLDEEGAAGPSGVSDLGHHYGATLFNKS